MSEKQFTKFNSVEPVRYVVFSWHCKCPALNEIVIEYKFENHIKDKKSIHM